MELLLLITYDMAVDKGRTKLSKQLEQFGFTRLQYSVFAGTATAAQWKNWKPALEKLFTKFKTEGDKLYMIPQSSTLFKQTGIAGTPFDMDWVLNKVQILYY